MQAYYLIEIVTLFSINIFPKVLSKNLVKVLSKKFVNLLNDNRIVGLFDMIYNIGIDIRFDMVFD
jgi:hypothetical protein